MADLQRNRTSVLINNYNNAPFLAQCVDSVLAQRTPADEIIVYDDGSTDASGSILQRYGPALKIIYGPRGRGTPMENQAVAIEGAFRISSGDFIFLLDSDDAFMPDKIAVYLEAFARSPKAVVVQAPMLKIDEEGTLTGLEYDPRRHAKDYVQHIAATQDINIFYPTSALAFARSYFKRRIPLDVSDGLPLWPDARLTLIAPHFGEMVTLNEPHTLWRRHARSHTVLTRTSVYEQTRMNRRFYNAYCVKNGLPRINPWRSSQQRRRWLRHICPQFLLDLYQLCERKMT